ncbi:MAG TPA: TIGR02266 family protein [Thermoanaerobaculia bacterium]|nr:TIGR02266 family protein [Thermoanaerobaculia bacterium]
MSDAAVPRDSRRIPLATRVQLKFEWFSGFISEFSSNISPGGMFIRTQNPEPVGRVLGFEFRLGDGFELIQGTGEVVWTRQLDAAPDAPAGMGIRFLELSPLSRELIYKMVDNYVREGGTPFDVASAPAPATPADAAPAVAAAPSAPKPAPPQEVPAALPQPLPPLASIVQGAAAEPPPAARTPPPALPASPALAAPVPAPTFQTLDTRHPLLSSRILRWSVLAGVLGLAAWAVLTQGNLLGRVLHGGRPEPPTAVPERPARPAPRRAAVDAPALPAPTAPIAPPIAPTAPSTAGAKTPAAPAARSAPASEIEKITWEQTTAGTEVVLWGNGAIHRGDYTRFRIDGDPPREVIKLAGIRRPFAASQLTVATRQVRQVRTGYHVGPKSNELHIVLDLTGGGVEVTGIEEDAGRLRIHLQGG